MYSIHNPGINQSYFPQHIQTRPNFQVPDNLNAFNSPLLNSYEPSMPTSSYAIDVSTGNQIVNHIAQTIHSLAHMLTDALGLHTDQRSDSVDPSFPVADIEVIDHFDHSLTEPVLNSSNEGSSFGEKVWDFVAKSDTARKWGSKAIDYVGDIVPSWLGKVGGKVVDWVSKIF